MGFFSKVGKFLKKSIKNSYKGGSLAPLTDKIAQPVTEQFQSILGLDALKDLAVGQENQLKQQQEANKLDASIESQNVAQFDESSGGTFSGTDNRRKKGKAGAYSSALGLQI